MDGLQNMSGLAGSHRKPPRRGTIRSLSTLTGAWAGGGTRVRHGRYLTCKAVAAARNRPGRP
jgi:hypothetical protein